MIRRAVSLDAFRGYAILTMVLSAAVASGVLPGWMYHAQIQYHGVGDFNPDWYGITWVDLVFPFFLFAMGAAFPFSVGKKLEKGERPWRICFDALLRGLRLAFFAIYIMHLYPHSLSGDPDAKIWCISLVGFLILFPTFTRLPFKMPDWACRCIQLAGYAMAVGMLWWVNACGYREFSLGYSNIIILVLANMAFFGTVIYVFTYKKALARVAVLPMLMGILLSATTAGSWCQEVVNFSPFPWLYRFAFLKYLFIVIPGSIAGEWLLRWLNADTEKTEGAGLKGWVALLALVIVVANLCGLYSRMLVLNVLVSAALIAAMWLLLRREEGATSTYWQLLFKAGAYLLILGLLFEAYQGGIRKDITTYSFYFVTSGLAFFSMIVFSYVCDIKAVKWISSPLALTGQNPMLAYVTPQLCIWPILGITSLTPLINMLNSTAFGGFMRGVIITALAMAIASLFTRLRWVWRT